MRRAILTLALLGLASGAWAQDFIQYTPPRSSVPSVFDVGTSGTGEVRIYNVYATEYTRMYWTGNEFLATTTGANRTYRFGSPGGMFNVGGATGHLYPDSSDAKTVGLTTKLLSHVYISRGFQGSKSTALADNTKKAFATVAVAAGSYVGGDIVYTLYCADASDRVSRSGRITFAAQNTGGTETCAVGTPDTTGDVTNNAKAFTSATFTCADGGTNAIQIEVQADCTIATPTTLTIEHRFDQPVIATVTPAT